MTVILVTLITLIALVSLVIALAVSDHTFDWTWEREGSKFRSGTRLIPWTLGSWTGWIEVYPYEGFGDLGIYSDPERSHLSLELGFWSIDLWGYQPGPRPEILDQRKAALETCAWFLVGKESPLDLGRGAPHGVPHVAIMSWYEVAKAYHKAWSRWHPASSTFGRK